MKEPGKTVPPAEKKGRIHREKSEKIIVFPENSTVRICASFYTELADFLVVSVGNRHHDEFSGRKFWIKGLGRYRALCKAGVR